jgi:hypothetical protein
VLRRVLNKLHESFLSDPRDIVLAYVNAELRGMLDDCGFLVRTWEGYAGLDQEDLANDEIGSQGETCAIYRTCRE